MATGFVFPFGVAPDGTIAPDPDEEVDLRGKIIQVLFTAPGERVNHPDFGCGLFNLVFDPGNIILAAAMEFTIGAALTLRSRKEAPSALKALSLFLITALIVILPWMARNQKAFGIFKLSTVDAINMVYYAGAGPYQLEYGLTLQEAQQRISKEYGLASNFEYHNPWLVDKSIKQLDAEIRAVTMVAR